MANAWIIEPKAIVSATSSGTSVGAPINVANDFAGVVWRASPGNSAVLLASLPTDTEIDTIMLFGLEGANLATLTAVVRLATDAQGATFTGSPTNTGTGVGDFYSSASFALLAGAALPTSGKGVMLWSRPSDDTSPLAIRHVRIAFAGMGGAGTIQAARLVAGKRIQLERNFAFGLEKGIRDLGSAEFSARGAFLRRRAAKLRTLALTFSSVRKDEVETLTAPLIERVGNTEMVAVVTDPSEHTQRQNRCYFGPLVGDLNHAWRNAAAWEIKLSVPSAF